MSYDATSPGEPELGSSSGERWSLIDLVIYFASVSVGQSPPVIRSLGPALVCDASIVAGQRSAILKKLWIACKHPYIIGVTANLYAAARIQICSLQRGSSAIAHCRARRLRVPPEAPSPCDNLRASAVRLSAAQHVADVVEGGGRALWRVSRRCLRA